MQGFDHDLAGWKLKNAHVVKCDRCHTAKTAGGFTRFSGLSQVCASCHQQRSPHGSLAECERCHTDSAWKPPKAAMDFDHDRDTKTPLIGSHKNVACAKCHPKGGFAATKPECSACHPTTKHKSPLFDATTCARCHTPQQQTFKTFAFDHNNTKFPLEAGHRVDCAKCHTAALGGAKPSTVCETCHSTASKHGKRFDKVAGGCAACHTGSKWTSMKFNHSTTKMELRFKHADIKCRACHRGSSPTQFEDFKGVTGCKDCHQHATVHADPANPKGKYTTKQCLDCHQQPISDPGGPNNAILIFHGPKSKFPLVKGHKAVPCVDCHTGRTTKGRVTFDGISTECGDTCHEDSAHEGLLGKQCTKCHTSGTWDALFFEHTRYPLDGEHAQVKCDGCHGTDKKFRGTPRTCGDARCHARDDVHGGSLGKSCNRCHLTNGDNRFNHQISAKFKLDGKHTGVTCDVIRRETSSRGR
jgi:hypothetical protein